MYHEQDSEYAEIVWDFESGQVALELELVPDPSKIEEDFDAEKLEAHVGHFVKFLGFELHQYE